MSLISKIILRNLKNQIIKSPNRMVNFSPKFLDKKRGQFEISDAVNGISKENVSSKLKVRLYPGFQQSVEEMHLKKSKEDEEIYGWVLKKKLLFPFTKLINYCF